MDDAVVALRFGDRIRQHLAQINQNQAWLAEKAGIDSSVLSRLISGSRNPTIEHVGAMAPVLGTTVDLLVIGTDAEARIAAASQYVPREHYEAAHHQLVEFERQKNDLEARLRRAEEELQHEKTRAIKVQRELTEQLGWAHHEVARSKSDLAENREQLRHYGVALQQAASDVSVLKAKLTQVQAAVSDGTSASRLAAALAGVAAIGAVTAATYLHQARGESPHESPPAPASEKQRTKPTSRKT